MNFKRDISPKTAGNFLFYTYKIVKLIIFILDIYVIYSCIVNHEPKLLTLSFILNILYVLIYINRWWAILICGGLGYYFTNNIWQTICLALAGGNGVAYIIDFITITAISLFLRIVNLFDKNRNK